jgi:hypothetical protein
MERESIVATYVLVHGGGHGGWTAEKLAATAEWLPWSYAASG